MLVSIGFEKSSDSHGVYSLVRYGEPYDVSTIALRVPCLSEIARLTSHLRAKRGYNMPCRVLLRWIEPIGELHGSMPAGEDDQRIADFTAE